MGYSLLQIFIFIRPCIPQFCYIKVGYKGVYITRICYLDAGLVIATSTGVKNELLELLLPDKMIEEEQGVS